MKILKLIKTSFLGILILAILGITGNAEACNCSKSQSPRFSVSQRVSPHYLQVRHAHQAQVYRVR